MICNVCDGTGFVNTDQIPEGEAGNFTVEAIEDWVKAQTEPHDVCVCHCCGDGESGWHGVPGSHYIGGDMIGRNGPYAYNGGLCLCH